jgi:hypothetical protein
MPRQFNATAIAAEFVPDGDPYRSDMDDPPRPAGTYLTVRLDDDKMGVVGGRVIVEFVTETQQ